MKRQDTQAKAVNVTHDERFASDIADALALLTTDRTDPWADA